MSVKERIPNGKFSKLRATRNIRPFLISSLMYFFCVVMVCIAPRVTDCKLAVKFESFNHFTQISKSESIMLVNLMQQPFCKILLVIVCFQLTLKR